MYFCNIFRCSNFEFIAYLLWETNENKKTETNEKQISKFGEDRIESSASLQNLILYNNSQNLRKSRYQTFLVLFIFAWLLIIGVISSNVSKLRLVNQHYLMKLLYFSTSNDSNVTLKVICKLKTKLY